MGWVAPQTMESARQGHDTQSLFQSSLQVLLFTFLKHNRNYQWRWLVLKKRFRRTYDCLAVVSRSRSVHRDARNLASRVSRRQWANNLLLLAVAGRWQGCQHTYRRVREREAFHGIENAWELQLRIADAKAQSAGFFSDRFLVSFWSFSFCPSATYHSFSSL